MSPRITNDTQEIRKHIREAEAVTDEALIACAKLKQVILKARQNPEVSVDAAQRVLMRLQQAEEQALSMSTSLLRTHSELNKVARIYAGGEDSSAVTPMTAELDNHEDAVEPVTA